MIIVINNNEILKEFLKAKFTSEIKFTKPISDLIFQLRMQASDVHLLVQIFKAGIDYKFVPKNLTISIYNELDFKFFLKI